VRARFTDYVQRFVRLASRYEEDTTGTTTIGFRSLPFTISQDTARLGSGMFFVDDAAGARELQANAARIEGWRRTELYARTQQDFAALQAGSPIQGFDLGYQIWRFRAAKNLLDGEVELFMRTLLENVRSYDQVVELLSMLPAHSGGLLPLSFGLFHQQEHIRDLTVDLFTQLRMYPVHILPQLPGRFLTASQIGVQALQALNHFQRYAYVRQAHARERPNGASHSHLSVPAPTPSFSRSSSNRSDVS